MQQKIIIALLISLIAAASGCVGFNDASPDTDAEEIEDTQDEVLNESETLQSCTTVNLELSMIRDQLVVQQTSGAEGVGEVEVEIEKSSGETLSRTVTIERSRGTAGVSVSGEVDSATATPLDCEGAAAANYP